jgi:tetratricopeptide (TPR) repeat protein
MQHALTGAPTFVIVILLQRRALPATTGAMNRRHARHPASLVRRMLALCLAAGVAFAARAAAPPAAFVRQMNVGKAHLENRNSAKAIEAFSAAVKLEPKSASALRNLARAQLLANQNDEALRQLAAARALEKESVATAYLTGLAYAHQSQFEKAVPFFAEAVRLDPHTATLRFQLANACQLARQDDKALTQLRETIRLDPLHGSAHFKLATYAIRAGDQAGYEKHQQEFQRLRKIFSDDSRTPTALERCLYTQPEPVPGPTPQPAPGILVRFLDASAASFGDDAARAASAAAVLDVDDKGACTLFVADAQGGAALLAAAPGRFARTPVALPLTAQAPFHHCAVGNYHDDVPPGEKYDASVHAKNDVLLVSPKGVVLLKRIGPAAFQDETEKAGLATVKARRAAWVDYDHDGDLDLALAAADGLHLWQNNGNGTFTNVTQQAGLGGAAATTDVTALDLDSNVAVDLVTARGAAPTLVFLNQRAGQFARMTEPPGPWPPARRVLADDLDNDGNPDALLVGETEALVLFGKRAARQRYDLAGLQEPVAALLDFDNDGWLDVCVAGTKVGVSAQGAIRLWRNNASNFTDATEACGLASLELPPARDLIAADLDNDGDTDLLVVTTAGRLHFLRNDGGNAHTQLKLRLVGLKTNPLGLGTRVETRAGDFWLTRSVAGLPIELGLGRRQQLDSVQTVWGNGVVDNQIDVAVTPAPLTIAEKNVAAGSCPYLYAWDGRRFRFVTDLLGNSPLGLSLRRGEVLPADPEEIVVIGDAATLQPRRGFYELEVTEELREVLYLDQARLIAVDHPPGVEVHSTDKLGPPPFAPSELWALHSPRPPRRAVGDDGVDRTEAVRARDGVFAPPGRPLPPPLRGQCEPLTLTLDFGPLDAPVGSADSHVRENGSESTTGQMADEAVRAPSRQWVLALTGWIQYGDASVNIAASQKTTLPVIPPKLEVETAGGRWQPVEAVVGMPAGKTKTILCDLTGKLPPGATRLRLMTTFELRWDRIALLERSSAAKARQHALPPSSARLRFRGFSEIKSRAAGHPQTPDYARVFSRPPWRTTPQGWCTRYGEVLGLVTARDERLALLNAGDALTLRFDARALPPLPRGWQRTFAFYSVGWDKDADHNVVEGDTVEPLPVSGSGDWRVKYNTRWVGSGRFGRD